MKPIIFLLVHFFLLSVVLGQSENNFRENNTLKGKLLFINSDKTPAVGVEVQGVVLETGDSSNLRYSQDDGFFQLRFANEYDGFLIKLKVGDKDQNGGSIEVVNTEELRHLRISANPNDYIEVRVCRKGQRDEAVRRYYRIIKLASEEEIETIKGKLNVLFKKAMKDDHEFGEISSLSKKLDILIEQSDSISVYRKAYKIASMNRDNANERLKKFIIMLDQGNSWIEAINVLNFETAKRDLSKGADLNYSALEELSTIAAISSSMGDFEKTAECYDVMIDHIMERQTFYSKAEVMVDAFSFFNVIEDKKRLDKISKLIYFWINEFGDTGKGSNVAPKLYRELAVMHRYRSNIDSCLYYNNLSIQNTIELKDSSELAICYNNIGMAYLSLGKYDSCIFYLKKSLIFSSSIRQVNNLSYCYVKLEKDSLAIFHAKNALKQIDSRGSEYWNFDFDKSNSFRCLGNAYANAGLFDLAVFNIEKAVYHARKTNLPKFINDQRSSQGIIYLASQEDSLIKESVDIFKECLSADFSLQTNHSHPDFGINHWNLALSYIYNMQIDSAVFHIIEAILNFKYSLPSDHPDHLAALTDFRFILVGAAQKYESEYLFDKVEYVFDRLIELGGKDHDSKFMYMKADYFFRTRKYREANALYEKVSKVFPNPVCYNMIGLTNYYLGNYDKAINNYLMAKKTVSNNPDLSITLNNNLGMAYAKSGMLSKAKKFFSEYEKQNPNNGRVYRNWSMYYALKANNKKKAILFLKKAVKYNYSDLVWLKSDPSMNLLRNDKEYIQIVEELELRNQ